MCQFNRMGQMWRARVRIANVSEVRHRSNVSGLFWTQSKGLEWDTVFIVKVCRTLSLV